LYGVVYVLCKYAILAWLQLFIVQVTTKPVCHSYAIHAGLNQCSCCRLGQLILGWARNPVSICPTTQVNSAWPSLCGWTLIPAKAVEWVSKHTAQCGNAESLVLQHKLVSGWQLLKQRSLLFCCPLLQFKMTSLCRNIEHCLSWVMTSSFSVHWDIDL